MLFKKDGFGLKLKLIMIILSIIHIELLGYLFNI